MEYQELLEENKELKAKLKAIRTEAGHGIAMMKYASDFRARDAMLAVHKKYLELATVKVKKVVKTSGQRRLI